MAVTIGKTLVSKLPVPTVQQLVDIIHEYNVARAQELSQKPPTGWPAGYKNPYMDNLFDAANQAAALLKPALTVKLEIVPPK